MSNRPAAAPQHCGHHGPAPHRRGPAAPLAGPGPARAAGYRKPDPDKGYYSRAGNRTPGGGSFHGSTEPSLT